MYIGIYPQINGRKHLHQVLFAHQLLLSPLTSVLSSLSFRYTPGGEKKNNTHTYT
jgi:hypothetical protein